MTLEAGHGDVDEISRAVVEGDGDRVGGTGRPGRREGIEARVQGRHPTGGGQRVELRIEQVDGQVDL